MDERDEAAVDEPAVEQDGARAALPFAAAFLGAGEIELAAQHVEQPRPSGCPSRRLLGAVDAAVHLRSSSSDTRRPPMQRHQRSGVSGSRVGSMPVACATALKMAGAGPSIGSSPMPLAPPGPCAYGRSSKYTRIGGRSIDVGMM